MAENIISVIKNPNFHRNNLSVPSNTPPSYVKSGGKVNTPDTSTHQTFIPYRSTTKSNMINIDDCSETPNVSGVVTKSIETVCGSRYILTKDITGLCLIHEKRETLGSLYKDEVLVDDQVLDIFTHGEYMVVNGTNQGASNYIRIENCLGGDPLTVSYQSNIDHMIYNGELYFIFDDSEIGIYNLYKLCGGVLNKIENSSLDSTTNVIKYINLCVINEVISIIYQNDLFNIGVLEFKDEDWFGFISEESYYRVIESVCVDHRYEILLESDDCEIAGIHFDLVTGEKSSIDNKILIDSPAFLSCGDSLPIFSGGAGIYDVVVDLGTSVGEVVVEFNSFNIPDRFQIIWDGKLVADSLFLGDRNFTRYQNDIINATYLGRHVLNEDLEFDFIENVSVNYDSSDIVPTIGLRGVVEVDGQIGVFRDPLDTVTRVSEGQVQLFFNKDKPSPSRAVIRVIGASDSTAWSINSIQCPTP